MKRLVAHISGRVQAVGYRSMVVRMARILDIKGYVQNLPDGKVFIIAEGQGEDLVSLVKSIRVNNSNIWVDDIFIGCKDAKGEFDNFNKLDLKQTDDTSTGMALQSRNEKPATAKGRSLNVPTGLEKICSEIENINLEWEKIDKGREELKNEIEPICDLLIDHLLIDDLKETKE